MVNNYLSQIASATLLLIAPAICAQEAEEEYKEAPKDAVIIHSGSQTPMMKKAVWDALYAPSDWFYEVRQAPRFLFVDQQGKIALGIGGQVKGTLQYDFDGSEATNGDFIPQEIPVPRDPRQISGLNGTVNNSKIYFRLVGYSEKMGLYGMYIETKFDGGPDHNCFKLKEAWVQLNYLRAGLITSLFNDDDAQPKTIDEQGPAGATCTTDVAVQWTPRFGKEGAFTAGIGVELPKLSVTEGVATSSLTQRAPDVPAYLQYAWNQRASRVRLSAIWRNLTYRDDLADKSKWATGWGVQCTGIVSLPTSTTLEWQMLYGKGVGQYVNDLSGYGYDLIPTATPGKLEAPGTMGFFAAVTQKLCEKVSMAATYSQARLFNQKALGADAYRYGQYVAVNAIYEPIDGLKLGVEYDWGKRTDVSHASNHANRIMLMGAYSF